MHCVYIAVRFPLFNHCFTSSVASWSGQCNEVYAPARLGSWWDLKFWTWPTEVTSCWARYTAWTIMCFICQGSVSAFLPCLSPLCVPGLNHGPESCMWICQFSGSPKNKIGRPIDAQMHCWLILRFGVFLAHLNLTLLHHLLYTGIFRPTGHIAGVDFTKS